MSGGNYNYQNYQNDYSSGNHGLFPRYGSDEFSSNKLSQNNISSMKINNRFPREQDYSLPTRSGYIPQSGQGNFRDNAAGNSIRGIQSYQNPFSSMKIDKQNDSLSMRSGYIPQTRQSDFRVEGSDFTRDIQSTTFSSMKVDHRFQNQQNNSPLTTSAYIFQRRQNDFRDEATSGSTRGIPSYQNPISSMKIDNRFPSKQTDSLPSSSGYIPETRKSDFRVEAADSARDIQSNSFASMKIDRRFQNLQNDSLPRRSDFIPQIRQDVFRDEATGDFSRDKPSNQSSFSSMNIENRFQRKLDDSLPTAADKSSLDYIPQNRQGDLRDEDSFEIFERRRNSTYNTSNYHSKERSQLPQFQTQSFNDQRYQKPLSSSRNLHSSSNKRPFIKINNQKLNLANQIEDLHKLMTGSDVKISSVNLDAGDSSIISSVSEITSSKENPYEKELLERGILDIDTKKLNVRYVCAVCAVSAISLMAYKNHIRGRRHQKMVKNYLKTGLPLPPISLQEVKAQVERQAVPVGLQFLKTTGSKGEVKRFLCMICKCSIDSENTKYHCIGKNHRANLLTTIREIKKSLLEKRNPNKEIIKTEVKVADKEIIKTDISKAEKSVAMEIKVESSESDLDKEEEEEEEVALPSQSDDKDTNYMKEYNSGQKNPNRCNICRIAYKSEFAFLRHIQGSRHRKEVLYLKVFHGIKINKSEFKKAKGEAYANIPIVRDKFLVEKVGKDFPEKKVIYCSLCECKFSGGAQVTMKHSRGKRHRANYKQKLKKALTSCGT